MDGSGWVISFTLSFGLDDGTQIKFYKEDEYLNEIGVGLMAVDPAAVESGTIWSPYTRELYDNSQIFSLV